MNWGNEHFMNLQAGNFHASVLAFKVFLVAMQLKVRAVYSAPLQGWPAREHCEYF